MLNCQSPEFLYDELFQAVQMQRIFPDSKTFCDAVPQSLKPSEILDLYRQSYNEPNFNLTKFVLDHFTFHNTTIIVHDRWTIEEHCHRLWTYLTRTPPKHENFSSLIDVPRPFVVPGGRFTEFYYWDSYFTMLGLLRSNETILIDDMLENFAYLINKYGYIPNGNRNYYEGRSQPPFFSLMTELVNETSKYRDVLEKEYQFWSTKRSLMITDGSFLTRYFDDNWRYPRAESYFEDRQTEMKTNRTELFGHLRAAAESGWDFSSRWMENETDLTTTITADIFPVDLNCLLYHLEKVLGKTNLAESRRQAIQKHMWSSEKQFFVDYNFVKRKQMDQMTLAGLFPLWFDIATDEQAQQVAHQIKTLFLHDGGLVTTLSRESTQQWDSPNGWAPLQYIAYKALLKTPGQRSLALTIRDRWMKLNERVFTNTGKMMEKYDVINMNKTAGGGEYETQDGFGWTNAVYLEMLLDKETESNSSTFKPMFLFVLASLLFALFSR